MLMLTSSEFIALCRAQIVLLTQSLGASLSVVYLAEELAEGADTQLIPVIAYPESAVDWQARGTSRSLLSTIAMPESPLRLLSDAHADPTQTKQLPGVASSGLPASGGESASDRLDANVDRTAHSNRPNASSANRSALVAERRAVLPLMHEDAVLGVLVTERNDRPWTEWEQVQIHQIAETLAIACVLDQRYQWLKQDHHQQQLLQAQQHDLVDNLLHQFRNSLTALQTFGKLIFKRLLPGDANREIAASLVRETTRLRDLAQQLETAVAETDVVQTPLALPPAIDDRAEEDAIENPATGGQEAQRPLLLPASGLLSSKTLTVQPCDLTTILEPLLASTRAIAHDRALALLTDIPAALPLILANIQGLQEVLSNAIDNALKYTPAGGIVLIQVRRGTMSDCVEDAIPCVEIAITDTGPGIPPQDLRHLFERRYRGVQAQTGIPGSGLGLSIAQALITQMRGEIEVISPAQASALIQQATQKRVSNGSGTTVVVRLAVAPPVDSKHQDGSESQATD